MNFVSQNASSGREAILEYGDGMFHVKQPGSFVRCAVSNEVIMLDDLKYWSIDRQVAYVDAARVLQSLSNASRTFRE